jgi:uncharacterized membrane protein YciS (DUF1049 family)
MKRKKRIILQFVKVLVIIFIAMLALASVAVYLLDRYCLQSNLSTAAILGIAAGCGILLTAIIVLFLKQMARRSLSKTVKEAAWHIEHKNKLKASKSMSDNQ